MPLRAFGGVLKGQIAKNPPKEVGFNNLVGDEGLEPPTSSLSVTRSNQLS